jgi:hypothetical protein
MFYRYVSHLTKLAAYDLNATGAPTPRWVYVNAPLLIQQGFVTKNENNTPQRQSEDEKLVVVQPAEVFEILERAK